MDFFAAQDQARRLTWRLVLLFLAAVAAIVAGVNFIAALGVMAAGPQFGAAPVAHWRELSPALYGWVTLATLLIIGGGTLYRIWQLAEGGAAVARMMGARRVAPDTGDPDERRLMNVVEEMAIASGTPAPGVYLLEDERSINAFAAGYSPGEAIVAVTRGCMEQLSRDELQGVIAHEFSHILNGDMRLNIRLIGILNGILVIGAIGMALLRGASVGSRRRRYRSDRRSGGGVIAVLLLGAGLTAVGYAGVLAGRLIKAGVSRQREYFADASAVQFTRDPNGIAGALRKIRAHRLGSRVHNRYAEELSHMFFGPVYRLGFGGLLATHPPLDERIARIDPSFSPAHEPPVGSFTPLPGKSSPVTPLSEYQAPAAPASAVTGGSAPEPAEALASIGHPGPEHVSYAQSLHAAIPALLLTHAHRPHSAAIVLYGLIMQTAPDREQKLDALCAQEGEHMRLLFADILPAVDHLPDAARLPLLDLALPQLKDLPAAQRRRILLNMKRLILTDGTVALSEFALYAVARRHLREHAARPVSVKHRSHAAVAGQIALVLAALAHTGHEDPAAARRAYDTAARALDATLPEPPAPGACTGPALEKALAEIAALPLMPKRRVIDACTRCVLADNSVTSTETELLRALCDVLDCPMPPLISENGATIGATASAA